MIVLEMKFICTIIGCFAIMSIANAQLYRLENCIQTDDVHSYIRVVKGGNIDSIPNQPWFCDSINTEERSLLMFTSEKWDPITRRGTTSYFIIKLKFLESGVLTKDTCTLVVRGYLNVNDRQNAHLKFGEKGIYSVSEDGSKLQLVLKYSSLFRKKSRKIRRTTP